ncbi:MAG TPA: alpha/beta hydrolase [Thermomicrobiales bacterium]|nr:alpha/beta hydrolase [Thermomicrobiales bacterium]
MTDQATDRDRQVARMLETMRANWLPTAEGYLGERGAFEGLARLFPEPIYARHREETLGGVPVIATADLESGNNPERHILYLHGGAFVIGSPRIYREQSARIARAAGAVVHSVDYRLAPEHPFPAALEDATASYLGLLERGIEGRQIVIAGDSAGANLALGAAGRLKREGQPLPAGLVLLSPWVDLSCAGQTMSTNADARHLAQRQGLVTSASHYLGERDPRDPEASPLYADLSGLPEMLIQVGSKETLLDDARALDRRARAAGGRTRLEIYGGMVHEWHLLAALMPPDEPLVDAQRAVESIGAFVRERTDD